VPAHVVVHFDPQHQASREKGARSGARSVVSDRVKQLVADHDGHLSLTPVDPGSSAAVAMITVPDMDRANALADALRVLDGVEAAYSKPGEELP
jgi:hypothetical protein